MFDKALLRKDEQTVFTLRELYQRHGYSRYKMNKFEQYDLYMKNKDFLVSDGIITFRDTDGQLLALKPDVTLSIVKSYASAPVGIRRVYYDENVYRISGSTHTYKELRQSGLECMGMLQEQDVTEVLELALESLSTIQPDFLLTLSHVGLVQALIKESGILAERQPSLLQALKEKNIDVLRALCSEAELRVLSTLCSNLSVGEALEQLRSLGTSEDFVTAFDAFSRLCSPLLAKGYGNRLRVDFSVADTSGYYSGIVFKGYLNGAETHVLSGGEYDGLMHRMGLQAKAVGFAVYLDALEHIEKESQPMCVHIALPKGRLGEQVYGLFEKAGFDCPAIREKNRKLIFENEQLAIKFFWVKPSDVSIYVERGAADIGIAGKDILMEYEPEVYELLDLHVGKCRMAVAGKKDFNDDASKTLRVATKFPHISKQYYAGLGRDIDIIKLNGSIELAPILGLSDVIVDIVETGKTLLENGLEPLTNIAPISARLIANKASYRFKADKIDEIRAALSALTREDA